MMVRFLIVMLNMKRLLFFKYISFLFLFYFFSTARAQNLSAWEGHYAGTLKVKQMNGTDIVEHHMELDIKKHDDYSYDWVITYGDSAEDIRPYQMIYVDGDQYKLDEKNGIMIKVTKFDSEFIMLFEVGGSYLFVSYSLLDNAIGV